MKKTLKNKKQKLKIGYTSNSYIFDLVPFIYLINVYVLFFKKLLKIDNKKIFLCFSFSYIYIYICKMADNVYLTYYQKNTDVILNRAKEYYKNNKDKINKQAREKYNNSPEEKLKILEYGKNR